MANDQEAGVKRKDALMVQAVFAFAQGCGGTPIDDAAAAWFHKRYYRWIDGPPKKPEAKGKSPQDVWETDGPGFLASFKEIGRKAASGGGTISQTTLESEARAVETIAPCPYCPDPGDP
jgi:hypothetical protein